MRDYLKRLKSVLDSIDGLAYHRCHDQTNRWVQTSVNLDIDEQTISLGIIDHIRETGLVAWLYSNHCVRSRAHEGFKTYADEVCRHLKTGLRDIGYQIETLPSNTLVSDRTRLW